MPYDTRPAWWYIDYNLVFAHFPNINSSLFVGPKAFFIDFHLFIRWTTVLWMYTCYNAIQVRAIHPGHVQAVILET